jgi:hypothetical protein
VSCPLCGDETVHQDVATTSDPLLLMVAEASRSDYVEHLRAAHPQDWEREHAKETEMNEALARVFGRKQ